MNVNISNETIIKIAEEQIKGMLKPQVEAVLKDKYWMRQNLYEQIQACIKSIMEEKINEKLTPEKLSELIQNQNLVEHLSSTLINAVSTEIVTKLVELTKNY